MVPMMNIGVVDVVIDVDAVVVVVVVVVIDDDATMMTTKMDWMRRSLVAHWRFVSHRRESCLISELNSNIHLHN